METHMATHELPPSETPTSSHDAQRRLWFEYLAKLNDRELQSARASGFTPWALLAVVAAIVYKGVPQIPFFLSIPGALTATLVILVLEANVLVCCLTAFVLCPIYYCATGIRARLLTEQRRRAHRVTTWTLRVSVATAILAHFLASAHLSKPTFVRWVLVGLGAWWSVNLLIGIVKDIRKTREAKKHQLVVPTFDVSRVGPDWTLIVVAVINSPLGILAFATLLVFLRSLQKGGIPWVILLGAGTQVLVVIAVFTYLFSWALRSLSRSQFLALEGDIILANLSPDDIRGRFIREVLGPSVGDWLESLDQIRRGIRPKITELTNNLKPRVDEIEAIDPKYSHERSARAQTLLDELNKGLSAQLEEVRRLAFQVRQLTEVNPRTWETSILHRIAAEWMAEGDQIVSVAGDAGRIRAKLEALTKPPK